MLFNANFSAIYSKHTHAISACGSRNSVATSLSQHHRNIIATLRLAKTTLYSLLSAHGGKSTETPRSPVQMVLASDGSHHTLISFVNLIEKPSILPTRVDITDMTMICTVRYNFRLIGSPASCTLPSCSLRSLSASSSTLIDACSCSCLALFLRSSSPVAECAFSQHCSSRSCTLSCSVSSTDRFLPYRALMRAPRTRKSSMHALITADQKASSM
mmetsp:Transcript_12299/g.26575  ORF Transcript_12299/g.26575 Transcript_12299/m.26575 type:complete len:215 (-) Transcript_12299:466-1110(-)